jgi:release factor glutamine methyltransferase
MYKAKKIIREKLAPIYPPEEVESLSRFILEHVTGFSRMQMHLNQSHELSDTKIMQIGEILNRLLAHEPIQYIIGEADFFGLKLNVTPDVLIPRSETEELVDWILHDEKNRCRTLLDIGTGSGCIPISLDLNMDMERIEGWDISVEAIHLARYNAQRNGSKAMFSVRNILDTERIDDPEKWEVIVSNPPYVLNEESVLMEKNVVNYEPHTALFVPDQDPLIFYRFITRFAKISLHPLGRLYFEINEKLGAQVVNLLTEEGFNHIQLRKDLQGKDRMVKASR